jgi:hypothetical protein
LKECPIASTAASAALVRYLQFLFVVLVKKRRSLPAGMSSEEEYTHVKENLERGNHSPGGFDLGADPRNK